MNVEGMNEVSGDASDAGGGVRDLSGVEWGDVVRETEGLLVVEGSLDGQPVLVRRREPAQSAADAQRFGLLGRLGVPVARLLGSGSDWVLVEDAVRDRGLRTVTEADLASPTIMRQVAGWFARLHDAGTAWSRELAQRETRPTPRLAEQFVTTEWLQGVADHWPQLTDLLAAWEARLPHVLNALAARPLTLTMPGFSEGWFAVDDFTGEVVALETPLLERGVRADDVRELTALMTPDAAAAFTTDYERQAGPLDPAEIDLAMAVQALLVLVLLTAAGVPDPPADTVATLEGLLDSPHTQP